MYDYEERNTSSSIYPYATVMIFRECLSVIIIIIITLSYYYLCSQRHCSNNHYDFQFLFLRLHTINHKKLQLDGHYKTKLL